MLEIASTVASQGLLHLTLLKLAGHASVSRRVEYPGRLQQSISVTCYVQPSLDLKLRTAAGLLKPGAVLRSVIPNIENLQLPINTAI